jgi:IS30 family transposase
LVERSTRFLMLVRIPYDRTADRVASRLSSHVKDLPDLLKRSVTWDQGVEMAAHVAFSVATDVPVYRCTSVTRTRRGNGAAMRIPMG